MKNKDVIEAFKMFDFDITDYLKEYIEINTYATKELTLNETLGKKLDTIRTSFLHLLYDTKETIIKVSDYNKIARFYGNKEFSLNDLEYIIVADFKSMVEIRNMALENQEEIKIFGKVLKPKFSNCQEGFIDMSSQHINTGIIVVPDDVIDESYIYQNYLIGNYNTTDKHEIINIENTINELSGHPKRNEYLISSISTKLSITEATIGLAAMVTFIGLYLGVIFLISSAAIIGLKELSESSDNKYRFKILRKIGVDESMLNKALFKEIIIFFLLPLVLAVIHSIFGIMFAIKILEVFGSNELLSSVMMTLIFIILIYGGYFLITYYCSKNIIKERR